MGVDFQSGRLFDDGFFASELRAYQDGDSQENALTAARVGARAGIFLVLSGHCHSSLSITSILYSLFLRRH